MDKPQSGSKRNMGGKGNFPTLQNSMMISKTMLSVSKVDLDSRMIYNQHLLTKETSSREQTGRSYSGMMKRIPSKSSIPGNKVVQKDKNSLLKPKVAQNDFHHQNQPEISTKLKLRIEKAKISSKSYGLIQAYAANSHPGPYNHLNEDRVCIITNLTKNHNKDHQISFFAIYDGHNGSTLADYMRDNFHHILISDKLFCVDIEEAIKNSIITLENEYKKDPLHGKNQSSVSFAILIIVDKFGYFIQLGEPRLLFSRKLGKELVRAIQKQQKPPFDRKKIKTQSFKRFQNNTIFSSNRISFSNINLHSSENIEVRIRKIQIDKEIDFIIMGSNYLMQYRGQGVFESLKDNQILKKVWKSLLQYQNQQSIHVMVGEAANDLVNSIFNTISTKNVSLIIIAFSSIVELMTKTQDLELPFFN